MKLGFWSAILVGATIEFLAQSWFFHGIMMKEFIERGGSLISGVLGGLIGLACGFLCIYPSVFRDRGDGSATQLLGLFIGFSIGYPLYCMLALSMPVLSAIVWIVAEVGVYLICYEYAVRRARRVEK